MQVLVNRGSQGIILAPGDRTIQLNERGEEVWPEVKGLLPLLSQGALLAVEVFEGMAMKNALRKQEERENIHAGVAKTPYGEGMANR